MAIVDTSGNTVTGSGSFQYIASESDLLYRSLIKPIRDLDRDQGSEFVKRFLARPQSWVDDTATRIHSLGMTDSPVTCRADLLQYLKDHVGFTKDLKAIVDRLSEANLRKLIGLAVPMWRRKGTADGLEVVCRLLTGRTPVYIDWFQYRNILGLTQVGGEEYLGNDNWIIGGEVSFNDEFISHLRVVDDGNLDPLLLLDLLAVFRPTSERIEVALVDFLDRFDDTVLRGWAVAAPFAIISTLDTVNREMVVPFNAGVVPLTPYFATPDAIHDVVTSFKVKFETDASLSLEVGRFDANNCYRLVLKPAASEFHLLRRAAGVETSLSGLMNVGIFDIIPDVYYAVRVEVLALAAPGVRVRVYIDSNLIYEALDLTGNGHNGHGTVLISNIGADDLRIDNFELHAETLRFATIGPTGITKTSNFTR